MIIKALFLMFLCVQLFKEKFLVESMVENDLSIQTYTDTGEVAQLSYAALRIKRGNPTVAFIDLKTNMSCIISISHSTGSSSLSLKSGKRIDYHSDLQCAVLATGYIPDCSYVTQEYFSFSQNHRLLYSEAPSLDALCSHLSSWMPRGLYRRSNYDGDDSRVPLTRSLAASILLTKFDDKLQKIRLACVEHTGFVADYQHYMIGSISSASKLIIKNFLALSSSTSYELEESCIDNFICKIVNVLNVLENEESLGSNSNCDCEITVLNESGAVHGGYIGSLEDKQEEISRLVYGLLPSRYRKIPSPPS